MKKKKLILSCCVLIFLSVHAQHVLPGIKDFGYTFKITTKEGSGTSFLVSDSTDSYIVTAKHMFGKTTNAQKVSFSIDTGNGAINLTGRVYIDSVSFVDVAVIKPDKFYAEEGISLYHPEAGLGMEGYFLGFPFNFQSSDVGRLLGGFPMALVKRCSLSGIKVERGITMYLMDGQNNPGFSGGPVFMPMSTSITNLRSGLLGIISGYYPQYDSAKTSKEQFAYAENSGIMLVFGADLIKRILSENNLKLN